MKRTKIAVVAAIAVLGLGALAAAAVKANAGSEPVKSAAPTVMAVDQSTTAEPAEPDAGLPDTDNVQVQEGDQNGPDTTAAEAAGEQAGPEAPGNDGPGGHADEPGNPNADHQFQGEE